MFEMFEDNYSSVVPTPEEQLKKKLNKALEWAVLHDKLDDIVWSERGECLTLEELIRAALKNK